MSISIRQANIMDTSLILSFIQRLAEYEKLSSQCMATEEALRKTLFSTQPFAYVIIAEFENQPVGFALYFYHYSTFLAKPSLYLEDLFVQEEHRGKGIGFSLLQYLSRLALQQGCGRFEWSVLDWNTPAIRFYRRLGAIAMEDWTVQRLDEEAIKKLASMNTENASNQRFDKRN